LAAKYKAARAVVPYQLVSVFTNRHCPTLSKLALYLRTQTLGLLSNKVPIRSKNLLLKPSVTHSLNMSAYFLRKWETFFVRFDVDGDGMVTAKDFEIIAERLIENQNLDLERGTALKTKITQVFTTSSIIRRLQFTT